MLRVDGQDGQRSPWLDGRGITALSCAGKLCGALCAPLRLNRLDERSLRAIACYETDTGESGDGLRIEFRVTAGYDQQRAGMAAARLRDHAARAAIPQVRDGTGIDNVDIGGVVEVALREACRAHLLANGLAIGLVDLAAQRGNRECRCCCRLIAHDVFMPLRFENTMM